MTEREPKGSFSEERHQSMQFGKLELYRHDYDGDYVQVLDRTGNIEPGCWARQTAIPYHKIEAKIRELFDQYVFDSNESV